MTAGTEPATAQGPFGLVATNQTPLSIAYQLFASTMITGVGVFIAYWIIGRRPVPVTAPMPVSPVVALARADVGGNAINETLFARPGIWLTGASVYADAKGVDGAVNGLAATLGGLSGRWRHWQNGYVRSYALSMFAGTLVVILLLLLVRFA